MVFTPTSAAIKVQPTKILFSLGVRSFSFLFCFLVSFVLVAVVYLPGETINSLRYLESVSQMKDQDQKLSPDPHKQQSR